MMSTERGATRGGKLASTVALRPLDISCLSCRAGTHSLRRPGTYTQLVTEMRQWRRLPSVTRRILAPEET
jgi:hypothetical protein